MTELTFHTEVLPKKPASLSIEHKRLIVLKAFEALREKKLPKLRFGKSRAFYGVTLETLRATSTMGTILEPAVTALAQAGVYIESTVGAFMDALGIDVEVLHKAFWLCEKVDTMDGVTARARLLYFLPKTG